MDSVVLILVFSLTWCAFAILQTPAFCTFLVLQHLVVIQSGALIGWLAVEFEDHVVICISSCAVFCANCWEPLNIAI